GGLHPTEQLGKLVILAGLAGRLGDVGSRGLESADMVEDATEGLGMHEPARVDVDRENHRGSSPVSVGLNESGVAYFARLLRASTARAIASRSSASMIGSASSLSSSAVVSRAS